MPKEQICISFHS